MANCYEDEQRAEAYAELEFPGTYGLAYRDLPRIISDHVVGRKALDFGCGTGRSTRFLKELGFATVGVDIAEPMIRKAKEMDPTGVYHLIQSGDLSRCDGGAYDLVLSAFTFDNIPGPEKVGLLWQLGRLLGPNGRIINLVSTPDIYTHEWASFSTRDFPENRFAKSGDTVRIVCTETADPRPVEDVLCTDEDYQETFTRAGLAVVKTYRPLADGHGSYPWVNETRVAPWTIYVLKRVFAG